jgi:hypothetical protein
MITYTLTNGADGCFREEFENLEDALAKAWVLALELAELEAIPEDDIGQYGDEELDEWGVCPDNNDGAFWPRIIRRRGGEV